MGEISLHKQNQAHKMLGCLLKDLTAIQLVIIIPDNNDYSTVVWLSQAVNCERRNAYVHFSCKHYHKGWH